MFTYGEILNQEMIMHYTIDLFLFNRFVFLRQFSTEKDFFRPKEKSKQAAQNRSRSFKIGSILFLGVSKKKIGTEVQFLYN